MHTVRNQGCAHCGVDVVSQREIDGEVRHFCLQCGREKADPMRRAA